MKVNEQLSQTEKYTSIHKQLHQQQNELKIKCEHSLPMRGRSKKGGGNGLDRLMRSSL